MKQTKKLTRSQREYLTKKHIPAEMYRLVEETKDYITIQHMNGDIRKIMKGDRHE